jgi:hypothetical protein
MLAIGLVVVLAALLAVSERRAGFSADDGSYAIQSEALADHGSWAIDWPFREVDATARHFPYHAGSVSRTEEFAYTAHPAWPAALSIVRGIGGEEIGLRLLPLAGVVGAALVAFHLAGALGGPSAAPWGFAVAAASPLLANGFMLWAHAPIAALAGLALLALVRSLQRVRWEWAVVLGASLGGGVLLRSEGVLFAGAVVFLLGSAGLVGPRPVRRDRWVLAAVAAGASAAAYALDSLWSARIIGDRPPTSAPTGPATTTIGGRIDGAITSLLDGSLSSRAGGFLALVGVALVALALVGAVRPQFPVRPTVALVAAAGAGVARILAAPDDPVLGLFAAAPALLLAALAVTHRARSDGGERDLTPTAAVVAVGLCFAGAVLATQYDDGGGVQWGGRYLAPALVPLAALVAVSVGRLRSADRRAPAALAGLLLVGAVAGFVVPDEVRRSNVTAVERIAAPGNQVVLVGNDNTARLDWRHWPERRWLATNGDAPGALEVLRSALVRSATAVLVPLADLEAAGGVPVDGLKEAHHAVVPFLVGQPIANVRSQVGADG